MTPAVIVHHKAALDASPYPPNSLEAIRACLEAGAAFIEIDVMALAGDDYLLVHDDELEHETSGMGSAGASTVAQVRPLLIKTGAGVTAYRVPLLSEVVALFGSFPGSTRLQIDFKNVLPMPNDEPLRRLVRLIEPLGGRVLVSSCADWHLRALHRLAARLDLGFDIGYYLDDRPNGSDPRKPPYRVGAYGYYDDHLLATLRLLSNAQYLAERCEILRRAIPEARTWYVNYTLILRALDEGFDLAAWLTERGIILDAWTLDTPKVSDADLRRLRDAGVRQFTSNTPRAVGEILRPHP